MRYSTEPRFRKYVKGYGILSFARKFGDNSMDITRPRDVHKTSLLGTSVHIPYCTSIGRPFSVHCNRVDRRLIWTSNGGPNVAQSRTSNFSHVALLFK